ncbi:MAG: 2-amino-4-hydroxy-6-hydroxymethyldihydropteridine diphosphokinase [Candidatus Electrothrix scaldis]|nr:MAG: 2-amino-4-hydroxy-6-hydroxymethyldihydropteridine diphosphokinase [Candidatus Electrothrix sp. GW3-3]
MSTARPGLIDCADCFKTAFMDTPFPASAYIGLGSNLGNSRSLLQEAWQALDQHPEVTIQTLSSPYRTQPVGMESEHWFINAVGCLHTRLSPEKLLDLLLATEHKFGRIRHPELEGYQDRTLDLDLLLYEDLVLENSRLILPHPALHERLFVLVPLSEIGARVEHPRLKKSIAELLAEQETRSGREGIEQSSWQEEYAGN